MSNLIFPASLRPIVSKGYGQTRGGNISRTNVQGGMPRQSRDTYYDSVPIDVKLVVGKLGRQAFWSFITKVDGSASSFQMNHDTGLGIQPHNVLITSTISETTQDGLNWVIQFTATAERTAIQDSNCLTENLPDLYGCYGDGLNCFLDAYEQYCTSYPFIWGLTPPSPQPVDGVTLDFINENFYIGLTPVSFSEVVDFSRSSVATGVVDGILTDFTSGQPRLVDGGILIEKASTNLVLRSSYDTSSSWVSNNATNSTLSRVSLNSQSNWARLVSQSTDSVSRYIWCYPSIVGLTEGSQYTISVDVYVPLSSPVDSVRLSSSGIDVVGLQAHPIQRGVINRIKTTGTKNASALNVFVWPYSLGSATFASSIGQDLISCCNLQLEAGGNSTSIIKTSGATSSRSSDFAKVDISDIASGFGVVFAEYSWDGVTRQGYIFNIGDDAVSNRITAYHGSGGVIKCDAIIGGSLVASISIANPAIGSVKLAVMYGNGLLSAYVNGVEYSATYSGLLPIESKLNIGSAYSGFTPINSQIATMWYRPYGMMPSQLVEVTS